MSAELTHDDTRRLVLTSWVEGLGAEERARLQTHLAGCADCAAYAERIESGLAAIRAEVVVADSDLVKRTRTRLRAHGAGRAQAETRDWLPVGACLVACAAFVLWSLLAQRLVAWCAVPLGIAAPMTTVLVSLFWFLPSALTATAILLLPAGRPSPSRVWLPE